VTTGLSASTAVIGSQRPASAAEYTTEDKISLIGSDATLRQGDPFINWFIGLVQCGEAAVGRDFGFKFLDLDADFNLIP